MIIKEIGDFLNSTLETKVLMKMALEKFIRFSNSDKGSVALIDKESKILNIKYQVGLDQKILENLKIKVGKGITGLCALTKKPIIVNDVNLSKDYIFVDSSIRSEMAVPIFYKKNLLGVISVDSKKKDNYSKKEMSLLVVVANQFGQALRNIEYTFELNLGLKQNKTLLKINKILSSSLNLNHTLEKVLFILKQDNHFKRGALILYNRGQNILEIQASFGYSKEEILKGKYKKNEGIVGKTYQTQEAIAIENYVSNELFLNKTKSRKPTSKQISFFSIPLVSGAEVIGVMMFDESFEDKKKFNTTFNFLKILGGHIEKALQIHFLAYQEKIEIEKENMNLKNILTKNQYDFKEIIGRSKQINLLLNQIKVVSESSATILITGESGTGKELTASSIHSYGNRKNEPFLAINCAAIPEALFESELFGHKKGAFTGAYENKLGKFQLAHKGTLFLDEIGEMPLLLQSKLLRVLQEGKVVPLGSNKEEEVDVRVITATNQYLFDLIEKKQFREDLYYRLSTVPVHLPPLRERKEDIPLLVDFFLKEYRAKLKKPKLNIESNAFRKLMKATWKGNIRELKNVIERSILFSEKNLITEIYFDEERKDIFKIKKNLNNLESKNQTTLSFIFEEGMNLKKYRNQYERKLIESALRQNKGISLITAKKLGISRETLRKKIRELKINIYRE